MCVSPSHTSQTALQLLEKSTHEKQDTIVALWDTKSANLKVWTQTWVMCESLNSLPSLLLTPLILYTQEGPSEDMQSGGEAGLAHTQQQEDGEGVSHWVRIHSCSK